MAQEVIEVVEREVEVIEILERGLVGPTGPVGPQANINYTVVSSSQAVSNRQMIAADTSGGSFTLTLPSNPAAGDAIDIFDYSDTFDTNPLTIARNGQNIEGLGDDLIANVEGAYFTLIFTGGTRGWQVVPRYGVSGLQNVLTTEGDLLYRGGSAETRLGIGTAGQILKVNSGATAPEWGNEVMSAADKTKLDGIAAGAEVNVNADWNAVSGDAQILNKPATFTPSSHTHGNITNDGKIGSTSGLPVVTTTAGAVTTLALGTANQVLRVNSGETGVEFGAGFDAASPPAIGNTTPAAGSFTTLSARNGTLNASAPVLDLAQTWNNSGVTFTGIQFNITNTASVSAASGSKYFEIAVGGVPQIRFQRNFSTPYLYFGNTDTGVGVGAGTTTLNIICNGGVAAQIGSGSSGISVRSDAPYQWSSTTSFAAADLQLFRDAADTLAQRRGATAQTFRLYNTFTDANNHERGFMRWSSNVLQIGTEKGSGGGLARAVEFQTDGTSRWQITTGGLLSTVSLPADSGGFGLAGGWITYRAGSTNHWAIVEGAITQRATGNFQWSGQSDASNFSGDWLRLSRSAGGCLLLSANTSTEHRLQFGGTTNLFPALKRSSTVLQARLANDSDFCPLQGQLRTHANAVSETITATHTLTLYDAAGTAYKVPCVAA